MSDSHDLYGVDLIIYNNLTQGGWYRSTKNALEGLASDQIGMKDEIQDIARRMFRQGHNATRVDALVDAAVASANWDRIIAKLKAEVQ